MKKFMILLVLIIVLNSSQKIVDAGEININGEEVLFVFFSLPDGEAMLIQTGHGENYLVNTGSKISEEILLEQMNNLGVKQLDSIIFTNQNKTTCGNAPRLIKRYHVQQLIYSEDLSPMCTSEESTVQHALWKNGEKHEISPGLTFRVLPADTEDEMSLYIMYGKTSILYLASGRVEVEKDLIENGTIQAEILKVGDYARTQSPSIQLLEKVDPHVAMIYPLKGISPNEGLLERLNESWIDVYQLRKVGTTTIHCTLEDYDMHPK
ncbi:ComEC/Rec2 family competence protein [Pontibacillus marinus]|uniref:Hydrolase n=1 Tax=Pontibacillus marinus BH030004 = DSM 16465 TaxID=1385511 RepID=A0A0A5G348_9BACI|nr:hypothetical protein [Pontibacillus marinus]KGX85548.1 hypothetical protein N783_14515 [Pontibacillus marinus BH030004 = DSM 16465]